MKHSPVELNDLPDEILMIILKKLNNVQILYSLIGVNKRLNTIVHDPIFTSHLTLMRCFSDDSIDPLPDPILDRFCLQILHEIHHKIQWLNLESSSMKRILLATNYPNLFGLGLYDIEIETALSLVIDIKSSTLLELHICLKRFSDCLYLLDGRFNKLHTLHVDIDTIISSSDLTNNNQEKLPDLKRFSLYCRMPTNTYNTLIEPFLQRMPNLEKLCLNVICDKKTFTDGNELKQNIINHMPRLERFEFYICSGIAVRNQIYLPSKEDIQHTFRDFKDDQVISYVDYFQEDPYSFCHIYLYPDQLKYYYNVTNNFPGGLFTCVRQISLYDDRPFEHEFFLRIAESFPILKMLSLKNSKPQNNKLHRESKNDNQNFSIIKYPYLTNLTFYFAHDDYIEEFLVDTNICLPDNAVHLNIDYEALSRVTHNYTRDKTRINCAKLGSLCLNDRRLPNYAKDYFPLVYV
ncbi:unnamed protein product [Rotaria magnacalcarata]|uniref:F-box domain-containing protein n=2 Tax=Rotaria magnacalcarata TaxID=392030 RepID=A0A816ZFA8_9BILA|nr:unnamed protein product [Rotaria magnacalcarata]